MSENSLTNIYVISDSAGDTAIKLAHATMSQFPDNNFRVFRKNFIQKLDALETVLTNAKKRDAIIIFTMIDKELNRFVHSFCETNSLFHFDLMSPVVEEMERRTNTAAKREIGAQHHLNENYFKRIKAIEFAAKYDDGRDPKGFLKADVVILGVSRTSKTPLSFLLAQKNLKVANLPIVPQATIPDEIWKVDPKKIIGLTNDPEVLNKFRVERMRSYGLDDDTLYSNMDNILQELEFADELYKKIGCPVINVAQRSIEETAAIILEKLGVEDKTFQ
ncbi:hypothetical protein SAMN02745116_01251 [Pilibacter termitis]|uniref:Putative pyruvate, phosphate dikinase regulatory protein n=1 Tax=Pilibacter termitis TaxID=263852 RepID=A0A1T4MYH9_9ENTE|nr:pyruvate, water dikinase regulatory protein [Pilibacter termitis]SJZ71906.1 hypothetical protein SAMN02745116_01251 [Pilibacter termitis]